MFFQMFSMSKYKKAKDILGLLQHIVHLFCQIIKIHATTSKTL